MPIGNPYALRSTNNGAVVFGPTGTGAQNSTYTTNVAVNAGDIGIFIVHVDGSRTTVSLTDDRGNTWTQIVTQSTGGGTADSKCMIFRSDLANGLPSGSVITYATSGLSNGGLVFAAYAVSGARNGTDASGGGTGTTGDATASITTTVAESITFAAYTYQSGAVGITNDEDSDYTTMYSEAIDLGTSVFGGAAYRKKLAAGADTYLHGNTLTVKWACCLGALPAGSQMDSLPILFCS